MEGRSCERAGRLERGDADDGYTGTVDVKCYNFFAEISTTLLFSEPLLALIFCPGGSAGGKLTFPKKSFAGGSGHG